MNKPVRVVMIGEADSEYKKLNDERQRELVKSPGYMMVPIAQGLHPLALKVLRPG